MQQAIQLYECKKLHAKISLEACEQNRAKRTDLRAIQCETCQDYSTWGHDNNVPSSIAPRYSNANSLDKPQDVEQFICQVCGQATKHHALGLCRPCYFKQRSKLAKVKQTKEKVTKTLKCHIQNKCLKRLKNKSACIQCRQEEVALKHNLSKILTNFMQVTLLDPNLEEMTKRFIDYAAESYKDMNV